MSEESRGLLRESEKEEEDSTTEEGRQGVVFAGDGRWERRTTEPGSPYYISRDPLHVPFLVRVLISLGVFKYLPKTFTYGHQCCNLSCIASPLHSLSHSLIIISLPFPSSLKVMVYVLTFIGYATYHMSRKPFSVVKVRIICM